MLRICRVFDVNVLCCSRLSTMANDKDEKVFSYPNFFFSLDFLEDGFTKLTTTAQVINPWLFPPDIHKSGARSMAVERKKILTTPQKRMREL